MKGVIPQMKCVLFSVLSSSLVKEIVTAFQFPKILSGNSHL